VDSTRRRADTLPAYLRPSSELRKLQTGGYWVYEQRKGPGKVLVESLTQDLPAGMEFDETETATLALIEAAADRLELVRQRFAEVVADPAAAGSAVASWQAAIHQLEGDIFRWTKSLNLGATQHKSVRHQHAINTRWARAREA
jgi:hypothetical protein